MIKSSFLGKLHLDRAGVLTGPIGRLLPVAGFVVAVTMSCSRAPEMPPAKSAPPVPARLVPLRRGVATRSVVLPANVAPFQQATLYAKVAGYVKTVFVDKGDAVEAGKILADIEVPELLADRAKYAAELEVASADFKRITEAQAKAADLVIPQTVDIARGKYEIAKANLERIQTLLGYSKITAPFNGVITRRMVDPGAFVPAATSGSVAQTPALFTLMDFSRVRIQVAIPEIEVPFIKTGLPVKVSIEELHQPALDGAVTRFSQSLDEANKTMLAEIELPNEKRQLRPGMYAHVRLIVQEHPDALLVPTEALTVEKTRSSVFVADGNKAKRLTVKTGFSDAGWVEILEGIPSGQTEILAANQALNDGQPITVLTEK